MILLRTLYRDIARYNQFFNEVYFNFFYICFNFKYLNLKKKQTNNLFLRMIHKKSLVGN